jgi:hypothetical protein
VPLEAHSLIITEGRDLFMDGDGNVCGRGTGERHFMNAESSKFGPSKREEEYHRHVFVEHMFW